MLRSLLDRLYLLAGWAAGACLIAIFLLMMALSVGREAAINIPAGDDIASWFMAACAFLGLAHAFKSGEIIRVGLLIDRFQGRTRWWMEMTALLLANAFTLSFAWFAIDMTIDSWRFGDRAQGVLPMPMWIPQTAMAFGLAVLAIAFLDELVRVARGLTPTYEKAKPKTAEEVIEQAASSL